jgi:uncharacterized protein DUF4429
MGKQPLAVGPLGEFLAKGYNGQLLVKPDRIVIIRKGIVAMVAHGVNGDKEILLSNIMAIQLKQPGMTAGFIQFTVPGGNESRGGVFTAGVDENTVVFYGRHRDEFNFAKQLIEQYQQALKAQASAPTAAAPSPADELLKWAQLRDSGVITAEVFEAKKRQLLGL